MIDVAINVYGKPYQTALTLASLAEHSGRHIGRVFYQEESQQPHNSDVSGVPALFPGLDIESHVSAATLGATATRVDDLSDGEYRQSLRYQRAWERSTADYLFITHNDCLFTGDVLGAMLGRMLGANYAGVGWVGQCWNCPASGAGLCGGDRHELYHPSYEQAVRVVRAFPSARTRVAMLGREPMPFPECRLNDFACLINLKMLRSVVMPISYVVPFGFYQLDIGTRWFRELRLRGYRFANYFPHTRHAMFSENAAGHTGNLNRGLYDLSEEGARRCLADCYPSILARMKTKEPSTMKIEDYAAHMGISAANTAHHLIKTAEDKQAAFDAFIAQEGGIEGYVKRLHDSGFMKAFIDRFQFHTVKEGYVKEPEPQPDAFTPTSLSPG